MFTFLVSFIHFKILLVRHFFLNPVVILRMAPLMTGGGNGFNKRCKCAHVHYSAENNGTIYYDHGIFPCRAKTYEPCYCKVSKLSLHRFIVASFSF